MNRPSLEVVLELTRGHDAQHVEAPLRDETEYLLRIGEGTSASARFPWSRVSPADLQAVLSGDAGAQALQRVGDALRAFVDPMGWSALEQGVLNALAEATGAEVRIAIRCSAGELCRLPLELLTLRPSGEALGRKEGCHIQWEWPGTRTAQRTVEAPPEGGVLLFAWSAAGGPLGADRQLLAMQRAAKAHGHPGKVEPIAHTSLEALRKALDEVRTRGEVVSVLHLLCHGGSLSEEAGGSGLWLNGRGGRPELVAPTTLSETIEEYAGLVGCVVLCACRGADLDSRHNALGSAAQRLHRAGFPAVVASRAPLSGAGAEAFSNAFYDALLTGEPLHRAVAKGRRQLGVEWAALQVYTRAKDGPLYPVVFRPYRGLQSFDERDRRFFFGREELTRELQKRIEEAWRGPLPRFQLVAGTSGSGKSSLVKAGLVPELRRAGWRVTTLRPGGDGALPERGLERLARAFLDLRGTSAGPRQPVGHVDEVKVFSEARRFRAEEPEAPVLVVVDQMEESFHLGGEEPRRFQQCLWQLAKDEALRVVILGTFRADLLERAEDMTFEPGVTLKTAVYRERHRLYVEDMAPPELLDAIQRPLDTVGLHFEGGVAEQLCDEAGKEPGALPLLEHAMDALWRAREKGALTRAAFKGFGGLAGALSKQLDVLWDRLPPAQQREGQRLLVTLVDFAEDVTLSTRRRGLVSKLRPEAHEGASAFDAILEWLVSQRLLVRGHLEEEVETGGGWVEIAHETLIRRWTRLQNWLREGRDDEVLLRDLERVTGEWERQRSDKDKGESYLPVGRKLEGFEELERRRGPLPPGLARCVAAARDRRRRSRRRTQALIGGLIGVVILLTGLSVATLTQWRRAEQESRKVAQERDNARRESERADRERDNATKESANANRESARADQERDHATRERDNAKRERRVAELERDRAISRDLISKALEQMPKGGDPQLSLALLKYAYRLTETEEVFPALAQWANAQCRALLRHTARVHSATFSPDGLRVVTASKDGTARIWSATTGQSLVILHDNVSVESAAFSPDGQRTVTTDGTGRVAVWEATTGKLLFTLAGHSESARSATFSRDGQRLVTTSDDKTARIWDATTGKPLFVLRPHTGWVTSAVFSPDGRRVLTSEEKAEEPSVRMWDADTGKLLSTFPSNSGRVTGAAFSPDGQRVVTNAGVFKADTGELQFALYRDAAVLSAAFSPNGQRVVTASVDGIARIWEAATGELLFTLSGHVGQVNSAAFSPDGRRVVTAGDDTSARLWDAESGLPLSTLSGHVSAVTGVAFSPDGQQVVTASEDGTARVWKAATGNPLSILSGHSGVVTNASFSLDGQHVVTASRDGTARIWKALTGEPLSTLSGHTGPVAYAVFGPDGQHVLTASDDGTARTWDAGTSQRLLILSGHTGPVVSAAFSLDGRQLFTVGADRTLRTWEATTGRALSTISISTSSVASAAFSPDRKWVVTAGNNIIDRQWNTTPLIWELATGKVLTELSGHSFVVTSVAFSLDGRRVITTSWDDTTRLWDASTGQRLSTFSGHASLLTSAALSPDGKWVITAGGDRTARVWATETGQQVSVLSGHAGIVWGVAFSPDGHRVVTASADETARVWEDLLWAPRETQLELLNSGRDLMPDERRTYLQE